MKSKVKNMNDLAKRITLREGKKKVLNIGDVREVLSCVADEIWENDGVIDVLVDCAIKHSKKKAKEKLKCQK